MDFKNPSIEKRNTSKSIIDRSFPERKHLSPTSGISNNTACFKTGHTGQEHVWVTTVQQVTPDVTRCLYSSWKLHRSHLHNQEEDLPVLLQSPSCCTGSVEHFLSLQHSYSKFGVFRTILRQPPPGETTTVQRSFSKTKQTRHGV